MREDHRAALRMLPLFSCLSQEELLAVAGQGIIRSFTRGQLIFSAGDPGASLVVVLGGRVKVSVRSADGAELTLIELTGGQAMGELGVIDGGVRSAGAQALEPTDLLLLSRALMTELIACHPDVATGLMKGVAAGMRRLTDVAADLVFLDLPRRVAKFLLGNPRSADGWIELKLNQQQIAHQVAGTRQSVNASMRGFERRGWIVVAGRRIALPGAVDLARFVGQEPPR